MKSYQIQQIIIRANRPSYEFRDKEKQASAMVTLLCGIVLALAVAFAFCCKSCAPDPVAAYSMCEQCGEVITGSDHGRCHGTEVAHTR